MLWEDIVWVGQEEDQQYEVEGLKAVDGASLWKESTLHKVSFHRWILKGNGILRRKNTNIKKDKSHTNKEGKGSIRNLTHLLREL